MAPERSSLPRPSGRRVIPVVVRPRAAIVTLLVAAALIAGCVANKTLLLFVALKLTVWPDSLYGPGLICVAQFKTVCRPAFSARV